MRFTLLTLSLLLCSATVFAEEGAQSLGAPNTETEAKDHVQIFTGGFVGVGLIRLGTFLGVSIPIGPLALEGSGSFYLSSYDGEGGETQRNHNVVGQLALRYDFGTPEDDLRPYARVQVGYGWSRWNDQSRRSLAGGLGGGVTLALHRRLGFRVGALVGAVRDRDDQPFSGESTQLAVFGEFDTGFVFYL